MRKCIREKGEKVLSGKRTRNLLHFEVAYGDVKKSVLSKTAHSGCCLSTAADKTFICSFILKGDRREHE